MIIYYATSVRPEGGCISIFREVFSFLYTSQENVWHDFFSVCKLESIQYPQLQGVRELWLFLHHGHHYGGGQEEQEEESQSPGVTQSDSSDGWRTHRTKSN